MDRAHELDCIRRFLAHLAAGTTDRADAPLEVSALDFTDPGHFERERRAVFRRTPVVACLSVDLAQPGDVRPVDVGGVPLLLVRGDDGEVRAFVNACRHRGHPVVVERGCVKGGLIQCPFHAWTYSTQGELVKIPHAEAYFESLDRAKMGLLTRPVLELEGLVFVRAEGDEKIDAVEVSRGLRPDLEALDLGAYHPFETRTTRWDCNWKLVLDTFLESYHVFSLHRETVHPWYFSQPMIHDVWGRNIRFPVARRSLAELAARPEREWRLADHATLQWLIGANALLTHTRDYVLLWRFASPVPNHCVIETSLYSRAPVESDADRERLGEAFDLQLRVTGDEDFPAQERIQSVLDSGALSQILFGPHEVAAIAFHRMLGEAMDR